MGDTKSLAQVERQISYCLSAQVPSASFYGEKKRAVGEILRKLCEWKGVNILEAELP